MMRRDTTIPCTGPALTLSIALAGVLFASPALAEEVDARFGPVVYGGPIDAPAPSGKGNHELLHEWSGDLYSGEDLAMETGEFYDTYEVEVSAGENLLIEVESVGFDSWLMMTLASGRTIYNDDAGSQSRSALLLEASGEAGETTTLELLVSSYSPGEEGEYTLTVKRVPAGYVLNDAPAVEEVEVGSEVVASLAAGDATLDSGEFYDYFRFFGEEGDQVSVSMRSTEIDSYLILTTPGGSNLSNDDFEGERDSRVHFVLPESGEYRVQATSYASGEEGEYSLLVENLPFERLEPPADLGRIFGIFVGVGDYGDRISALDGTALDARRFAESLAGSSTMAKSDITLLVDEGATAEALREAVAHVAAEAGDNDTVVFFFSGHGDRVKRFGDRQLSDMDRHDETIELYDTEMLDDEFAALWEGVGAKRVLFFLDSCYSGGFSGDLIDRVGRVGFFASEEAQLSEVAGRLGAGGYLSAFLFEAIQEEGADLNLDGAVNMEELRAFVAKRFSEEVYNPWLDSFIVTQELLDSNQRLSIESGSVDPFEILFYLR